MAFNLFGPPTKDDIKVGYIDPSLGYISKVSIDDANYYASNNPGTIFIFVNGNNVIKYLNINEVNKLTPNDLISTDECNGINQKKECGLPTIQFFGGNGIGAAANPIIGNDGALLAVDLISGGNGYEYPPLIVANDICNYGSGATLISNIGEITGALENNGVVEQYQIPKITDTDFGRIYGPNGEDLGSWSPDSYIKDNSNLSSLNSSLPCIVPIRTSTYGTGFQGYLKYGNGEKLPASNGSDSFMIGLNSSYSGVIATTGGVTTTYEELSNTIISSYITIIGRYPESLGYDYWISDFISNPGYTSFDILTGAIKNDYILNEGPYQRSKGGLVGNYDFCNIRRDIPQKPVLKQNNSLGKGVVIDVIVRDPGNGYTYTPSADTGYPVLLRLKKVIVESPGINYSNIDQIEITPSNGAVLQPILGDFGQIIDVKILNPGLGFTEYPKIIMVTPDLGTPGGPGGSGTPGGFPPGTPGGVGTPGGFPPDVGGVGSSGIGGSPPGIFDGSPTGVNASFLPVFEIVRDPIVPTSLQEKLIQVTDLVGLKQNGYINGRPYYGSVYYNQGVRFTGFYETIGSPIQVYDTLQESINAQIVTPASAIQRSGTDISSNNSRLNIPNTPQNLI